MNHDRLSGQWPPLNRNGMRLDLKSGGGFLPLARLTLRNLDPSCDDIAFDPTMHNDPEVEVATRWLSDFAERRPIAVEPGSPATACP